MFIASSLSGTAIGSSTSPASCSVRWDFEGLLQPSSLSVLCCFRFFIFILLIFPCSEFYSQSAIVVRVLAGFWLRKMRRRLALEVNRFVQNSEIFLL